MEALLIFSRRACSLCNRPPNQSSNLIFWIGEGAGRQALQQQVEDLHENLQAQKQRAQRDSQAAWADSAEKAMVTEQVRAARRRSPSPLPSRCS